MLLKTGGPPAHSSKANQQARWEGKFAFFQMLETSRQGGRLPKGRLPAPDKQWVRAITDVERGLPSETVQSALTVILKLMVSSLTSSILIALSTVKLQFQGQFVSLSLRPVLGIVAAYVMATVLSSWINS